MTRAAMRLAFVGKGGAGKSVLVGCLARLLAREGQSVLAVDSDPLPGLSFSLGLGLVTASLPDDAVAERADGESGPRFRLRRGLSAADAVDRYAVLAPDGVRFLQCGKARGQNPIRSQWGFRQILDELPADAFTVVGDLPGGTRQPFFGWAGYADVVVVVVPPTSAGLLSARRLSRLASVDTPPGRIVAVVNKVRDEADIDLVRNRTGLDVVAALPWDARLVAAERHGRSVLDDAPGSAVVSALAALARRLALEAPRHSAPRIKVVGR